MTNKNLFNYKAQRFQSELNKTTFAYEVKRVRALWDPTLSIPGTNRRGGWRCPVGTRYGGQITDRFGRNCGWGVARRIANAITNIGERLESVDDRRRGRRVDRRNRRMMGRLQRNADAGRAERGLRGVADVLDGGEGSSNVPRTPRGRDVILDDVDVPERSPEVLDDVDAPEPSPVVLDDGGRPLDGRAARRAERKRRRQERRERREREAREREARGEPPPGQLGRGWRGLLDPNDPRYNEQGNRPWFGPPQNAPRADADEVDAPGGRRPGGRRRPDAPEADTRPRTPTDEDGGDAPGMPPRPARPRPPRDEEARPRPGERKPPKVPAAGRADPDAFAGTTGGPPGGEGREPGQIVIGRDGKPYKWVPNPDANAIGRGRQEKGSWVPASNVDLENDRLSKKRRRVQGDDFRNPKSPKGAPDPEGKTRIWTDDEGDQWEYNPNRREWDLIGNPDKRREAEEKDRKERGGAAGAPQPPNRPPFDSDERDAGLRESERRRVRREIEEPGAPRTETGEQPEAEAPKPKRPRRKPNRRRAASDEVATESATRRPPAPGDKPVGGQNKPSDRVNTEQEVLELDDVIQMLEGGSEPDSRSFRNVNNRFPKSGLPKSAFWRKPDYDGDDAEQLERRFSRYYDADGNINARGRVVNKEIARRKREGGLTPKGRKPRKPKAEKKPKEASQKKPSWLPKEPPKQPDVPPPPPMAATEEIPEYQRLPEEYKQQARKVYEDVLKDGDRRRKVQDDEVDKLIAQPEGTQKRLKLERAREDAEMQEKVYRQSRELAEQNMRELGKVPFNEMSEGMKRTYIDYVAGAMRSRKEEEYARRRRMRIVNALGEDAQNQPPDRPAPKPRDVRLPNQSPSQPSPSTPTDENNSDFKSLPDDAKDLVRQELEEMWRDRAKFHDDIDRFVEANPNMNSDIVDSLIEENAKAQKFWRDERDAAKRVVDEKGDYNSLQTNAQRSYYRHKVAKQMHAEKELERLSKRRAVLEQRKQALPAPQPPAAQAETVGLDAEGVQSPRARYIAQNRERDINAAIKGIHEGNEKLEDVPDGIVAEVVIDGELKSRGQTLKDIAGDPVTAEDILREGFYLIGGRGAEFENRRFKFKVVKSDEDNYRFRWSVMRVTDKQTGEVWFMKSSQYGQHDGLLENVGMKAAEVLEFGNHENDLRLGDPVPNRDGYATRWIMMRSVDQMSHGRAQYAAPWRNADEIGFLPNGGTGKVYEGDAARIAVLDFILNNEDRHGKNFMVNVDPQGRTRIAVIDNGLLGAGRVVAGDGREMSLEELEEKVKEIEADPGVSLYEQAWNNGIQGLGHIYSHKDAQQRERFAKIVKRAVAKLERELDTILSIDRIEANGIKLNPVEIAHIKAMRRMAVARIKWLKANQAEFVRKFN